MSPPSDLATQAAPVSEGAKGADGQLVLAWSGGKDSALALWTLAREGRPPSVLMTTVTEGYERVSMHGLRRHLLLEQSTALGLPLVEVSIPQRCSNELYERRMAEAFATPALRGAREVAFGDLFLEDVRRYREERLLDGDRRGVFPLWGRDTSELAAEFIAAGFRALIVCVDPRALDPSFAGRDYDRELLRELPDGVDPCGENGEFHTFVYDGPPFARAIPWRRGEVVERDRFVFCDVLPA